MQHKIQIQRSYSLENFGYTIARSIYHLRNDQVGVEEDILITLGRIKWDQFHQSHIIFNAH